MVLDIVVIRAPAAANLLMPINITIGFTYYKPAGRARMITALFKSSICM